MSEEEKNKKKELESKEEDVEKSDKVKSGESKKDSSENNSSKDNSKDDKTETKETEDISTDDSEKISDSNSDKKETEKTFEDEAKKDTSNKEDTKDSPKNENGSNEPEDSSEEESSKDKKEEKKPKHAADPEDDYLKEKELKAEKKAEVLEKQEIRKNEKSEKEQKKARKILAAKIVSGVVAGIAAIYLGGVLFFSNFSYPNTYVADTNVGLMSQQDLKQVLDNNSDNYLLEIDGLEFFLNIKGEDIKYEFDSDHAFKTMQESRNSWAWPIEIFLNNSSVDNYIVNFDQEAVKNIVVPAVEQHNAKAIRPQNAGFNIDAVNNTATIKNEIVGNSLDSTKTLASVNEKIGRASQELSLSEKEQFLPTVYSDDSRIENSLSQANTMLKSIMNFSIATTPVGSLNSTVFAPWLEIAPDYSTILNQVALIDWVSNLANSCNTSGTTRTFTTPYGKQVSVSGYIGWTVDEEGLCGAINENVKTGTTTSVAVPCSSSLETYAGKGGKDWGNRYIDVDLSEQTVRMYDDAGACIFTAQCVTGKPATPTPSGLFTVYSKQSPTVLHASDGSYHTPVSYWMPFSGGCGFHDATWQSSFGGNRWQTGYGSHGCVNLSMGSAASLYNLCRVGDIVAVHY